MKIKTADLIGAPLNWAVAKCEIPNDIRDNRPRFWIHPNNPKLVCRETYNHETNPKGYELCLYTVDWSQGGPIIDREIANGMHLHGGKICVAVYYNETLGGFENESYGPTPLIAAMRCYVASRLGDEVEIPEEVLERTPIGQQHESLAAPLMCCAVGAEEWGFGSDAAAAIIRALGDESPTNKDNH